MQNLDFRVCYGEFPVSVTDNGLDLGFAVTDSKDLKKALSGCKSAILFAASVGLLPDRLAAKYNRISPSKALIVSAVGSERVEALCDAFCRDTDKKLVEKGLKLRPRFSAGYGDLPLSLQTDIFKALDCTKKLGITLCDSLLMIPEKSVTAIAGITEK